MSKINHFDLSNKTVHIEASNLQKGMAAFDDLGLRSDAETLARANELIHSHPGFTRAYPALRSRLGLPHSGQIDTPEEIQSFIDTVTQVEGLEIGEGALSVAHQILITARKIENQVKSEARKVEEQDFITEQEAAFAEDLIDKPALKAVRHLWLKLKFRYDKRMPEWPENVTDPDMQLEQIIKAMRDINTSFNMADCSLGMSTESWQAENSLKRGLAAILTFNSNGFLDWEPNIDDETLKIDLKTAVHDLHKQGAKKTLREVASILGATNCRKKSIAKAVRRKMMLTFKIS